MSVQFGRWNLDGKPVDSEYLEKVGAALIAYGPDGKGSYNGANLSIMYYAFHTTKESRSEVQPHISRSGTVITCDGRVDNRADLIAELRDPLTINSTDVDIVATAFDKWGTNCFEKLIGDWAISICNPVDRSLLLAKDPIGPRHLYYSFDQDQITWSTVLDPVVRLAGRSFALNEEYIAGWLSMFPATHLTPCQGVHAVPPSSFVLLRPGKHSVTKYWDFDPGRQIRYRLDAEYEDHFRTAFATAIQRRLRSGKPVLAELSGGRDSSSIVCMADKLLALGVADTPRLDTLSYYDDDEPNWNERSYFTKLEERRGRVGWHINIGFRNQRERELLDNNYSRLIESSLANPCDAGRSTEPFRACLTSQGNQVLLSGIGGDEVMGGVPTPIPELEDLLASAHLRKLSGQLKAWALEMRKPWFHLFFKALRGFLPNAFFGFPNNISPLSWLHPAFAKRQRMALAGYPFRVELLGPLPTFQENVAALDAIRRQLACSALPMEPTYEKRYPYLDRDLLEFIYAIPRDQLVRPTQRRSLMRRALADVVPLEILNRKTKAFVSRSPLITISAYWTQLVQMTHCMLSDSLGIVKAECLYSVLEKARHGEEIPIVPLMRTIKIEAWLRELNKLGILNSIAKTGSERTQVSAEGP